MVQYQTGYLISHQNEVPVAIILMSIAVFIIQWKGHAEAGDLVWKGRPAGRRLQRNAGTEMGRSLHRTLVTAGRTPGHAVVHPFR